jgi:hypothetical protein
MDDKAQIIAKLRQEFNRWEELLNRIDEGQITSAHLAADLSIKDIIAHLTAWQQISVARMEAARQHIQPEYPEWHSELDPEPGDELDQTNAWIFERYQDQTWGEIHREWAERFRFFLEISEAFPEDNLFEPGRYPWIKDYPLSAVLQGTLAHHEEHRESLIALLDQK